MVFPFIIILSGFTIPKGIVITFALLLPFHLFIGIVITYVLKKMNNLLISGIGLVYILGVAFLWQFTAMGGSIQGIVFTVAATTIFFIWGVKSGTGNIRSDFHYFSGLIFHGASIFIISRAPTLKPFLSIAAGSTVLYVIAGLPLANRRFLIQETRRKANLRIIPGTIVRGNFIIVMDIIILMVLLSFWDTVLNAFLFAVKALAVILGKILAWLSSIFKPDTAKSEGGAPSMDLPPVGEYSNSILNTILSIIIFAILLFFVYLLIKYLVKNRKRLYAAFQAILSRLFSGFRNWSFDEQGYSDKQESLLKTEIKKKPSFLKRILSRKPSWKHMKDNFSRVRFIYTKLVSDSIRKGLDFSPMDTPYETVSRIHALEKDDLVSHDRIITEYNKVRYGEKEPTDETVNELKHIYIK